MTHSIDYPDWEDDALDCYHDGYERDILTGVATCYQCGERWNMNADEFQRSLAAQAAYDAMVADLEDEACPDCGGEGVWDDMCECQRFEDTCCCLEPTPYSALERSAALRSKLSAMERALAAAPQDKGLRITLSSTRRMVERAERELAEAAVTSNIDLCRTCSTCKGSGVLPSSPAHHPGKGGEGRDERTAAVHLRSLSSCRAWKNFRL